MCQCAMVSVEEQGDYLYFLTLCSANLPRPWLLYPAVTLQYRWISHTFRSRSPIAANRCISVSLAPT